MGLPWITETALVEVVAPEGNESLLLFGPVSRQGFLHRLRHPVVPDSAGHTAKEIEGLLVSFEQGFLLLIG